MLHIFADFFGMSEMSDATASKVIQITNVEEYDEFKKNKRGVVFYGAEWCEACQGIKDIFTRIANRYHKRIAMAYCDINVCGLDFSRVPVFVAMHNGNQISSVEGANDDGLKELVRDTIDYDPSRIPKEPEPTDPGRLDEDEVKPVVTEPKRRPEATVIILTPEPKTLPKPIATPEEPKLPESPAAAPVTSPAGEPSTSNISASIPKADNKTSPMFVMFEEIGLRPKKGAKIIAS
jgi:thiol-disulfide isomerase/thioredoxin